MLKTQVRAHRVATTAAKALVSSKLIKRINEIRLNTDIAHEHPAAKNTSPNQRNDPMGLFFRTPTPR